jgi:hypothetical protein
MMTPLLTAALPALHSDYFSGFRALKVKLDSRTQEEKV